MWSLDSMFILMKARLVWASVLVRLTITMRRFGLFPSSHSGAIFAQHVLFAELRGAMMRPLLTDASWMVLYQASWNHLFFKPKQYSLKYAKSVDALRA